MEMESPRLASALMWKAYSFLGTQFFVTLLGCGVVVLVTRTGGLLPSSLPLWASSGMAFYVLVLAGRVFSKYLDCHWLSNPLSAVSLCFFAGFIGLLVGLKCAFTKWRTILEAASTTAVLVVSFTFYAFWAAKRDENNQFLGHFLFCSSMALICFDALQIFLHFGKITMMIVGIIKTIIFTGYIVYDTGKLMKRYNHDDYIWGVSMLYLDIINLFFHLPNFFVFLKE